MGLGRMIRRMDRPRMRTLVIGGDSLIGRALAGHLRDTGHDVTVTTRRRETASAGRVPVDLETGDWSALRDSFDAAYLVAAIARLADCAHDPERAERINVRQTVELARWLGVRGSRIIFLSTNQVFDGTRTLRRAEEPVCPVTVYGRQKARAETAILDTCADAAVLRMTKVLGDETPLFQDWTRSLTTGRPIAPFADMPLAPVHVSLVADSLVRIGESSGRGIYQISATDDVEYADVGHRLAALLGASPELVRPASWRDSGLLVEAPAANTTLDESRLLDEFAIAAPGPWQAIDRSLAGAVRAVSSRKENGK